MTRTRPAMICGASFAILLMGFGGHKAAAEETPSPKELRTQKVGDTTYFHVRFDVPKEINLPDPERFWIDSQRRSTLARFPDLLPQDDKTRAVYFRLNENFTRRFRNSISATIGGPENVPVSTSLPGLEFVGKLQGAGESKFLLIYQTIQETDVPNKDKDDKAPARKIRKRSIVEKTVTLDFENARKVTVPEGASKRDTKKWPGEDDLEGLWAIGQATRFSILEGQSSNFGFYRFAREATGRKYKVPTPQINDNSWNRWQDPSFDREDMDIPERNRPVYDSQLYETTTGAAAIAESLQTRRMLTRNFRDSGERKVDIAKVPGIDIAEHPWQKMMGDKKPAPEPLARLVPNDNYYLHFKNVAKLIELGELMDQWGTTLSRAYEVNSRDHQMKQRYEKQLCLKSTWLGKTFGPAVIKSVGITGSDAYVREGSDVTVLFQVADQRLFFTVVDKFVQEARDEFKTNLRENKETYNDVAVESFVTPLREVSLHRASFGDNYVAYSNSPVALRRVIDTFQGKHKSLADSLDYQYMRTIFRLDDDSEDGFVFLSDPFIRQLVGPASKIKEKRRLEALTSLHMETNGALFTAWETGKLPDSKKFLLASSTLKPEEIYMPEGKEIVWDERNNVAVSDTFNTIHFATPIIEIPIDKITQTEEQSYGQFRAQYLGLWRGYFDPVGMRFSLKNSQVKVETYILPLIQNSQYNDLRRLTGNGTANLDVSSISQKSLLQFTGHIAPDARERNFLAAGLSDFGGVGKDKKLNWLGDWFVVRLDDSPIYGKLAELAMRHEIDPEESGPNLRDETNLFFQVPLTVGVEIKNPLVFAGILTALRTSAMNAVPDTLEWEPMDPKYKGTTIVRIRDKGALRGFVAGESNASLYYVTIDGAFYISLQEAPIKELIDRSVALREGKEKKGETVSVNSSLYLAPGAAEAAGPFLRSYLEWESHKRALGNAPILYSLYRCGVVPEGADEKTLNAAAMRYFGFIPVSPDGAAYSYEKKTGEVVNARHGTLRRPTRHAIVDKGSPLDQLLDQFRSIRADLRFREDGIHTVLTIDRKTP